jgi:UDP-2,3-diacylglucosamine pyrophosphatase LpxH
MKTVIFSDTHLGPKFDKDKYNFLADLINAADRIIINGDFWEGCLIDFNQFCQSPWSKLFSLLKDRDTYYLYGNHDPMELADERVNLFAQTAAQKIDLDIDGQSFHFEHGHEVVPGSERLNFLPNKQILRSISTKLMDKVERLGVETFGYSFGHLFWYRNIESWIAQRRLNKLDTEVNVMGHTHLTVCDHKNLFYIPGYINYGHASYLVVENGQVELIKSSY